MTVQDKSNEDEEEEKEFFDLINDKNFRIYEKIQTQLYEWDKRSFLSVILAFRQNRKEYSYLEIGSFQGGTLQPFLLDPKCKTIISIDKRTPIMSNQFTKNHYKDNTLQAMMKNLEGVSKKNLSKIQNFENDASEIDSSQFLNVPDFCFIDGEHTDKAVRSDFDFCYHLIKAKDAVILFHDTYHIFRALAKIVEFMLEDQVNFRAYALPSYLFVIEFNGCKISEHTALKDFLTNNFVAYLHTLTTVETLLTNQCRKA